MSKCLVTRLVLFAPKKTVFLIVNMNEKPRIKPELTTTDKTFEILSWLALLGMWVLVITNYASLPDQIPVHFNAAREADAFGGKGNIWGMPIISTALFGGLTILNKFPHVFNYPTKITADNALSQYTIATRLIRYAKLSIVIIFGIIVWQIIRNANGETDGIGAWFLPIAIGLVFIATTYFGVKLFTLKK